MSKVTFDEIMAACERDDGTGFCRSCGAEVSGVEPDARKYACEVCGEKAVFGAEELLMMGCRCIDCKGPRDAKGVAWASKPEDEDIKF